MDFAKKEILSPPSLVASKLFDARGDCDCQAIPPRINLSWQVKSILGLVPSDQFLCTKYGFTPYFCDT